MPSTNVLQQVEDVTLWRGGVKVEGSLHLMQHHMVFHYVLPAAPNKSRASPTKREMWITYPMIAFCTYRPAPLGSRIQSSIRLRGRDFTFVAFHFVTETKARLAYDTIRNLTCRLGRIEKLLAFSYQPYGPEKDVNGWNIYNPAREWERMGVGSGLGKTWRTSQINTDYEVRRTFEYTVYC